MHPRGACTTVRTAKSLQIGRCRERSCNQRDRGDYGKRVASVAVRSYLVECTTTGGLTAHERTEFWREHVSAYHCRLDCRYPGAGQFDGGTIRQCTEAYQLVDFWSEKIKYVRTAGQVRQDPDDAYRLVVPTKGAVLLRQGGVEAVLPTGSASLLTLNEPAEMEQWEASRAFIMTIPAREVDGPLNRSEPAIAGLDMTCGLGRVVGRLMATVSAERDHLSPAQFDAVCDRIVEMLCMLVTGDDRPDAPGHLAEVEAMVRRYVRAHATEPDLTGAAMAHELGWSLRQIQVALQRAGTTPRELIREERLRLVRDRLRNPAYRHMSITDLAHQSGFSSVSVLSTAFRQRFVVSPREVRH